MRDPKLTSRARALRQASTVAERELWRLLRAHRLNGWGFRRQSGVAGYVVDFVCHDPKLVVEIDGPVHERAEQEAFDQRRDAEIEALGFTVVRINEKLVRERPRHALAWISFVGRRLLERLPPYPEEG